MFCPKTFDLLLSGPPPSPTYGERQSGSASYKKDAGGQWSNNFHGVKDWASERKSKEKRL
jgi:hypothetical protein